MSLQPNSEVNEDNEDIVVLAEVTTNSKRGQNEDSAANEDNSVSPTAIRRTWTATMSTRLGLSRRRVQKMLAAGAPDSTDEAASQDWAILERNWRGWIATSPRYRSLATRLRPPLDLDHAAHQPAPSATRAESGSAGGDVGGSGEYDSIKQRKCQLLDLQIGEKRGALIDRTVAKGLIQQVLSLALARFDELPALIAAQLPAEHRDAVRAAGKTASATERRRFESDCRSLWRGAVPQLIQNQSTISHRGDHV